ncbi:MAG TPA: hypothetical protein P5161_04105 [Eubacteriales bacterium]|jgi:hypothetical protein|nr:hypothetical protein [Clostridia bacterium]HRR89941.1 hypothetical protein [Eubacteriales bacterium]HRU85044.1 hypothetical protein [Eubacteriales bacterium]
MKISTIKDILNAEVIVPARDMDAEVNLACASDMMSDVLAFVKDQAVLLTGLCNPQVIRTAGMMDMKCVVLVRGKRPDPLMAKLAEEYDIALLASSCHMYVACGLLYEGGLRPVKGC